MTTKSQKYYGNKPIKKDEGTGGLFVSSTPMRDPAKTACKECPLRRDSAPGYLGGYTPEMYIEVLHGPASIACHTSMNGSVLSARFCTGVAAFRANVGHVCEYEGVLTRANDATLLVGPDAKRFFATDEEFVEHHTPGQE